MSSRDVRKASRVPNGSSSKSYASNPPSSSRRSPPRDGYYAGGEFDEPLTPTSQDGYAFPGDDIYPSSSVPAAPAPPVSSQRLAAPLQLRGGAGGVGGSAAAAPPPGQTQQRGQSSRRDGTSDSPKSRPQSYAGSGREEYSQSPTRTTTAAAQAVASSSRNGGGGGGHYRRPSGTVPSSSRSQPNGQHSRKPSTQVADPPLDFSNAAQAQAQAQLQAQAAVSRLESPSITRSVLQPLEKKMLEYDRLMAESQAEVAHLDEELRGLQERRRRAEEKFAEAKTKHDEYERQHHDVGRALRGEISNGEALMGGGRPVSPPYHHQAYQSMELQSPVGTGPQVAFQERPMSGNSSRTTQKLRTRDRFRMSLFGRG